jgi:energy-converting hydrogenase B subunit Q
MIENDACPPLTNPLAVWACGEIVSAFFAAWHAHAVPARAGGPAVTPTTTGVLVQSSSGLGVLHKLTGVIAQHEGDITSVEIIENRPPDARIYFEIILPGNSDALAGDLRGLPVVRRVDIVKSFEQIYGKRIIIMGGGAQVGQVAIGAISEADRHNIRGEHISVDTIPLVGEQALAEAVRAVARLPRAKALVLAGSLMGGDIEKAVREVREAGLLVVSLNMAGSVPEAADLVVTDPVQAGVMTVMAVAETAKFTIERLKSRVF